jgi:hypothetical protein
LALAICAAFSGGVSPAEAQPVDLLGDSGRACLEQRIAEAGPLSTEDAIQRLGISFLTCLGQTAFVRDCPDGRIAACAFDARGVMVTASYDAVLRLLALPKDLRNPAFAVTNTLRRETYASCLSDNGAGVAPVSDSEDDLMASMVQDRIAAALCDTIYGLRDVAVIEGMAMVQESRP